jgi:hypothetical protein
MPPKLSPLDIPEILSQILSYIDTTTIEQSASRVNRTWFLLTRHRINQDLVFDTSRRRGDFNTVMARLPEATKVWWHAEYGRDRVRQWRRFVAVLRVKDLRYREGLKGTTTMMAIGAGAGTGIGTGTGAIEGGGTGLGEMEYGYMKHDLRRSSTLNDSVPWTMQERPLHELLISGFMNLELRFPPLVAYLEFLTVLKLTMRGETAFNLRRVLTRCGATLQILHIRTTSTLRLIGPWIPKRFATPEFVQPLPVRWQDPHVDRGQFRFAWNRDIWENEDKNNNDRSSNVLALRELVLERASFYQTSLEALLCFTPKLDTLRLLGLNPHSRLHISPLVYDLTRLLHFLQHPQFPQKQILPLKSFAFSVATAVSTALIVEQRRIYVQSQLCSSSQEWTLFTQDLSPTLLKFFTEEVQNVVTTLELRSRDLHKFSPDPVLHQYLCVSPHLMHLKAEDVIYLVELVDVFGRMDMVGSRITSQGGVATTTTTATTSSTTASGRGAAAAATAGAGAGVGSRIGSPGIWACKNLHTLHISFRSSSNTGSSNYAATTIPTLTSTSTSTTTTTSSSSSPISKISSRIVFGYISRVCPNLRSLKIHAAENFHWAAWIPISYPRGSTITRQRLSLTLDSGFCLLSGLKYLEELSIGFIAGSQTPTGVLGRNMVWGLERVDLDWILERRSYCGGGGSGNGKKEARKRRSKGGAREARRRVVEERWETWLAEEKLFLLQKAMDASWWISRTRKTVDHSTITTATAAAKSTNGSSGSSLQPSIRGKIDPDILEQLKDLGLLVDVKNVIEKMDAEDEHEEEEGEREGGYRYWPMLRWMRVYQWTEYGRSREREIKRMLGLL